VECQSCKNGLAVVERFGRDQVVRESDAEDARILDTTIDEGASDA